jgi:uncharacterized membrane protein YidH (DUF202 family)
MRNEIPDAMSQEESTGCLQYIVATVIGTVVSLAGFFTNERTLVNFALASLAGATTAAACLLVWAFANSDEKLGRERTLDVLHSWLIVWVIMLVLVACYSALAFAIWLGYRWIF